MQPLPPKVLCKFRAKSELDSKQPPGNDIIGGAAICLETIVLTVQFSSVAQSCPTLCDPMDCSTPGLPVHHQLLEFTQTHAQ